jgi:DNA-binding response OmpR family regulator
MAATILVADALEVRAVAQVEQLTVDGWEVRRAGDPEQARRLLDGAEVLVVGQFRGSAGLAPQLVRDVRAGVVTGADPHLRILSSASGDAEAISVLGAGADMTVARDASLTLLSASVAALMRREQPRVIQPVRIGALEVNAPAQEVTYAGQPIRLSGREMDVLVLLASVPGRVFTRDEISREVWGGPDLKTSRTLDTHVSRMAAKFRATGGNDVVRNVWGRGYKLNNDSQGVQR